jgi:hypothetical protein
MKTLRIEPQPDDVTCGPTCLHAVYQYYGDSISLQQVIEKVAVLEGGGTLAVLLGDHALRRGYRATIYTYNLHIFDPTWFSQLNTDIVQKLTLQKELKRGKRFNAASDAYLEFLRLGGRVVQEDLTPRLLKYFLNRHIPILTGLSATYLYGCAREREVSPVKMIYDDTRGTPTGHFVLLYSYRSSDKRVQIADPFAENPSFQKSYYSVPVYKLINAIMLGIVTYDANLLVIQPPSTTPQADA